MPQKFPAQPRSAQRKLVASASASRAPEPICWRSRIPRAGTNLLAQPHPARRNQSAGVAASRAPEPNGRHSRSPAGVYATRALFKSAPGETPLARDSCFSKILETSGNGVTIFLFINPGTPQAIRLCPGRLSVSDFPETVGYTRLSPGIPGGFSAGRSRFPSPFPQFFSPIPRVPAGSSYPLTTNIGGILTQNLI